MKKKVFIYFYIYIDDAWLLHISTSEKQATSSWWKDIVKIFLHQTCETREQRPLLTAAHHPPFLPHPFRQMVIKPNPTAPLLISLSIPLFSSVLSSGSNATASLLCPISSKICSHVREGHLNACGWHSQITQAEEHQFCLPWTFCLSQSLAWLTALFMQLFCCSLPALTNLVLTSWSPGAPPPLPSTDTCAADGTNGLAIIQCLSIGLPCLVLVMMARHG